MSYLLITILVVLLLSHFVPDLARQRRYDWFAGWLQWLAGRVGGHWSKGWALVFSLGLPLLVVGLVQGVLAGPGTHDLIALAFAIAVLFYAWGPRDLDHDIDTIVAAPVSEQATLAASRLGGPLPLTAEATVVLAAQASLRRWFGPLLWFLILGPVGALFYRLAQLATDECGELLPPEQHAAAARLLAILDWPAVQLMTVGMAIATDFDNVLGAWRTRTRASGGVFTLDPALLPIVAAAAVRADLAEDDDTGMLDDPGQLDRGALLRDTRSLAWRVLIVWLAVISLFTLAALLA